MMCGQIEIPLEIRRLRFQKERRHYWAMSMRTSLLSLLFCAGILSLFRRVGAEPPPGFLPFFLLLPVVLTWGNFYLAPYLESLPYRRWWWQHGRWQWNNDAVIIAGKPIRWSKLQSFQVTHQWDQTRFEPIWRRWVKQRSQAVPNALPPGFATFRLRMRDRFLEHGRSFAIIARADDVAKIAGTARLYLREGH